MTSHDTIMQARQALAARLKELRLHADGQRMTGERLAAAMGWEGRKARISKIENGTQLPSVDDIRAWATACGAEDQIPDLIEQVRTIDSMYTEWRRLEKTGLGQIQEAFVGLYERTVQLRVWQHSAVPGLLQTEAYARAHLSTIISFRGIPDDVERAVAARMAQQQTIGGVRRFAFLIGEQALRTPMVDPSDMAAQLDKLAGLTSGSPHVSVGILPGGVKPPVMPPENFWIYDTAEVRVDGVAAQFRIKKPDDVAVYEKAFAALAQVAVYGQAARELIEAAAGDI
ncbi:helix-turn-helix domain-containing protein [Nonomuraea wenchangensis]|uniref:Helix-turn-helix domain-containing protein n=1 Tax=Nonomuraea wenchangensis TaxID=568860 RepID=A0A1I0ERS0_9ACTN|nr:helix-turn-helix transcriptional regulator [Nonomuraea wenchangensis]SET47507.1 Helix-turn-helix domain-containing protein [Nonomuraea wenchangensis]